MAKPPNDPLREAIALAYSQTDTAPRVVARGKGVIAEKIIARAQEHGVYVHESPELVALLTQVAKAFLVFIHTSRIDIDDAILFWNRDHFRWFWGVAMDDRAPTDSLRISHKIPDP